MLIPMGNPYLVGKCYNCWEDITSNQDWKTNEGKPIHRGCENPEKVFNNMLNHIGI